MSNGIIKYFDRLLDRFPLPAVGERCPGFPWMPSVEDATKATGSINQAAADVDESSKKRAPEGGGEYA